MEAALREIDADHVVDRPFFFAPRSAVDRRLDRRHEGLLDRRQAVAQAAFYARRHGGRATLHALRRGDPDALSGLLGCDDAGIDRDGGRRQVGRAHRDRR